MYDNSTPFPIKEECIHAPGSAAAPTPASPPAAHQPKPYFLSRLAHQDVILFGTRHDRPSTTRFFMDFLPILAGLGITHVGLEIASDQQTSLDNFARSGRGLHDIDVFHVIDSPEYRCLLDVIRLCELKPVAMDLPPALWNTEYTRDGWMAKRLCSVFQHAPRAKAAVLVGNLHTIKNVRWIDPLKRDMFLPGHLSEFEPGLEVLSILADYEDPGQCCHMRETLSKTEKPVLIETRGLDLRLKVLNLLAARPMMADEVTDAVMMF